jgi:hypothetical protein
MKKTLEVLNSIAVDNGHKDWLELAKFETPLTVLNCTIEAMELYAETCNSHKHDVVSCLGCANYAECYTRINRGVPPDCSCYTKPNCL